MHVVLQPIPPNDTPRSPAQVRRQREASRTALRKSARLAGAPQEGWESDPDGRPLANAGFFWSVSHKRKWSCAAVAKHPVGIDIEHVVARDRSLHAKLATPDEWTRLGDDGDQTFYRLWTAKEATLKRFGMGVGEFLRCRFDEVRDRDMQLSYRNQAITIRHFEHDDHIVAVTCGPGPVHWHVVA